MIRPGTKLTYGMGIETGPVAGAPGWSHAGSTASYRAWLGYVPEQRLSVALLCNSGAVNTEELGPEVAARFLVTSAMAVASSTAPAAIASVQVPYDLPGLYRNVANDAVVVAKADAAGLHLNGGSGFAIASRDLLVTADGRRTVTVVHDRMGNQTGLIVTRIGNSPTRLERAAAWMGRPRDRASRPTNRQAGATCVDDPDSARAIDGR